MNDMLLRRRQLLAAAAAAGLTAQARAAFAADDAVSRALIGKLEGPEVVLDPAMWPKAFQEAPMLAARVAAGGLPKLAERIGADPLVIKPVHDIGRYGGMWRQGFTGPGDAWNAWRACTGPDSLLAWDWTGNRITPNLAKSWTLSDDGKVTTIQLRRGMRWSDGHPFTADDFVFWFEDIYSNGQLVPVKTIAFQSNDQHGRVEKVDDLTVRLSFPVANYLFPGLLAGTNGVTGPSMQGRFGYGLYAPAHYLKQFLPKYASEEKLAQMAKDQGFPT